MSKAKVTNLQLLFNGIPVQPLDLTSLEVRLPQIPRKPSCLTDKEWYQLMYQCEPRFSPTLRNLNQQPELQNIEIPQHQMLELEVNLSIIQDELMLKVLKSKQTVTLSNPIAVRLKQIVAISSELARLSARQLISTTMPVTVDMPSPSENTEEKLLSLAAYSLELLNTQLRQYKYPMTEQGLARLLDSIRHSDEALIAEQLT
ncbi:hypothetical protein pEaSNUABM27_00015 [Erwinia phage pEa_SNUABM_27]|nr:hypothetical protein pEaSNUABM27_00015 [Erwinia phage pEa_SNUABM_27]